MGGWVDRVGWRAIALQLATHPPPALLLVNVRAATHAEHGVPCCPSRWRAWTKSPSASPLQASGCQWLSCCSEPCPSPASPCACLAPLPCCRLGLPLCGELGLHQAALEYGAGSGIPQYNRQVEEARRAFTRPQPNWPSAAAPACSSAACPRRCRQLACRAVPPHHHRRERAQPVPAARNDPVVSALPAASGSAGRLQAQRLDSSERCCPWPSAPPAVSKALGTTHTRTMQSASLPS